MDLIFFTILIVFIVVEFYNKQLATDIHEIQSDTDKNNVNVEWLSDCDPDDKQYNCVKLKRQIFVRDLDDELFKVERELKNAKTGFSFPNPNLFNTIKCTKTTGKIYIIKKHNQYDVICECEHPKLVTQKNIYSDCDQNIGCLPGGKLIFNPKTQTPIEGYCESINPLYIPDNTMNGPVMKRENFYNSQRDPFQITNKLSINSAFISDTLQSIFKYPNLRNVPNPCAYNIFTGEVIDQQLTEIIMKNNVATCIVKDFPSQLFPIVLENDYLWKNAGTFSNAIMELPFANPLPALRFITSEKFIYGIGDLRERFYWMPKNYTPPIVETIDWKTWGLVDYQIKRNNELQKDDDADLNSKYNVFYISNEYRSFYIYPYTNVGIRHENVITDDVFRELTDKSKVKEYAYLGIDSLGKIHYSGGSVTSRSGIFLLNFPQKQIIPIEIFLKNKTIINRMNVDIIKVINIQFSEWLVTEEKI